MSIENIFSRYNLDLANSFIEDDEPTIAMFTDPKDEIFNLKISKDE